MKHIEKIQNLLPLGYLYLVVLGILNETVFFYQFNINILKYSSIMDVLISPIATLTSNPIIFLAIVSLFVFCYHLPSILYKHDHKKWVQKIFELKKTKSTFPDPEVKNHYLFVSVKTLATSLLSIYIGYGGADGYMASKKMRNNTLHYDYKLNYTTGESEEICLIKSNSIYYFYVKKGENFIKIAPIAGVKNLALIDKGHSK